MPTTRHSGFTEPNKPQGGPEGEFKPAVPELTIGTPPEQAPAETAVTPTPGETIAPENQESVASPTSAEQPTTPVPAPEVASDTPVTQDQVVQPTPAATMAEQHAALKEPITPQSMEQDEQGSSQEQPLSEKRAEMAAPHDPEESVVDPTSAEELKPKGLLAKIKSLLGGSQNNKEKIVDTTYHSSEADINPNRVTDLEAHKLGGAAVVNSADRYKVGTGQLAEEAERRKNEAA